MEKYSNQLTPEQLQAKFVLVSPILRSYEILGVNVGYTHRNDQGFKIFCAIMANCLRLAQVDRYKNGDTFTLNLDSFTDTAGRSQKAMSPRTMDDNRKLWIGILTLKNWRHGNASTIQNSILSHLNTALMHTQQVSSVWKFVSQLRAIA